jgi:mRNA-degrading endonuclease RelE of RelBE toxin-antitoxin system
MDTGWNVSLVPSAQREPDQLGEEIRKAAIQIFRELEEEAFPEESAPLRGYRDYYRIKFHGNRYRVIYKVSKKKRTIHVTRISIRSGAYIGYEE